MPRIFTASVAGVSFLLAALCVWSGFAVMGGQARDSVDRYNIPAAVTVCTRQEGVTIRTDVNPFYVSGDFDGDRRLDYAVQVRSVEGKRGILFCQSGISTPILLGAGRKFVWDDNLRFDAWLVLPKSEAIKIVGRRAMGDALHVFVKETASGLIYWDGRQYAWKQLDD